MTYPQSFKSECYFFKKNFSVLKKVLDKIKKIESYFQCSLLIPCLFVFIERSDGQAIENLKLRLTPYNNFSDGYDASRHTYRSDYIRNVLTNSTTRPIVASIWESIPLVSVRTSPIDQGNCPTKKMRLIRVEASTFIYTLKGRGPANQLITIQEIKKQLKGYDRSTDRNCIPLFPAHTKPVNYQDAEVKFSVPVPSGEAANATATYTVQFDVVGGNNKVLLSQTKTITILRHVPLIVSIGESLASGEGNPDKEGKSVRDKYNFPSQYDCFDDATVMYAAGHKPKMAKIPNWFEPRDHRSLLSSHALAAKKLLDDWPYVVFLTFAKSGSVISSRENDNDILEQLDSIKRVVGNYKIDALLVSAGGNDVGFADILGGMAKDFRGSTGQQVLSKFMQRLHTLSSQGYPSIANKIRDLRLNIGNVLINEYSGHPFNDRNGNPERGCEIFETARFWAVSKRDAVSMDRMGELLNDAVKTAAINNRWILVTGISSQFKRHGYCSGQSFYVKASTSCDQQGDFDGTMHPNEVGTKIYALAIARELRRALSRTENIAIPH